MSISDLIMEQDGHIKVRTYSIKSRPPDPCILPYEKRQLIKWPRSLCLWCSRDKARYWLTSAKIIIQSSASIFTLLRRRASSLKSTAVMAKEMHIADEIIKSDARLSWIRATSYSISVVRAPGILT